MPNNRMQLELVLDKLREIATINPTHVAMYIAETNALLQSTNLNFSREDLTWFHGQIEQIVEVYLGGRLFHDDEYASYRQALN